MSQEPIDVEKLMAALWGYLSILSMLYNNFAILVFSFAAPFDHVMIS